VGFLPDAPRAPLTPGARTLRASAGPDPDLATWDRLGLALLGARGCGCMLLLYILMGLAIGAVALVSLLLF
jgi:hypothetical protein